MAFNKGGKALVTVTEGMDDTNVNVDFLTAGLYKVQLFVNGSTDVTKVNLEIKDGGNWRPIKQIAGSTNAYDDVRALSYELYADQIRLAFTSAGPDVNYNVALVTYPQVN